MKTRRFPGQIVRKFFLVFLLLVLALQSSGRNGLAAAAGSSRYLQGDPPEETLSCKCTETNIQTVLMIDDSGSMRTNDPGSDRKKIAKQLLNALTTLLENPSLNLQKVQVAVIHFTGEVQRDSGDPGVDINPHFLDLTAGTAGPLVDIINWKPGYDRPQTTDFSKPFTEAVKLFSGKPASDCTRRSIVLLTDGTPEDLRGRLSGKNLENAINAVRSTGKDLELDKLIIIGFKVSGEYFNDDIQRSWKDIVQQTSRSQEDVPDLVLVSSSKAAKSVQALATLINQDSQAQVQKIEDYLKGNITIPAELQNYQNMTLKPDPDPLTFNPGVENVIKFKLLDSSDKPVLPGNISSYTFKLTPSIIQGAQEQTIQQSGPEGDSYQVSWTSDSSDDAQLKVVASFVDAKNQEVMVCSTTLRLNSAPVNPETIVLTLVVGSPRLPVQNGSVTLPLYLDYKGNKAPASSLVWDATASDLDDPNQTLTASVTPSENKTPGEYVLTVSGLGPITKVRHIQAQVSADAVIDEQPITTIPAATKFEIPFTGCTYSSSGWAIWFWPLVILLAALLIFLLVIGFQRRRDQDDARRGWQLRLRRGDWHFLFWPLLTLFILAVLVGVFELYCSIPPWIFLALLLVWLVMLVLVSFTPENDTRLRTRWLVILLALLIPVCYFIFPDQWPYLILLELLALAWLTFRRRPLPPAAIGISISLGSPLLPRAGDSAILPIELKLRGNQDAPSSLRWNFKSSSPLASWKITPEEPDRNEYKLILDGIGGAGMISVELSADVEVDNQSLATPLATAMIDSLPAPYLVLGSSKPSYAHPQESISLPLQLIYSGDRAWTSSLEWTPSVNSIPGGATVKPVNAEIGEYELVIDPVANGEMVEVAVGARAVMNGRSIEIPGKSAALQIVPNFTIPVPIDHLLPIIISLAVPLDCVPAGQEITLPVQIEIKEPMKVSSFVWTLPPAKAIPGGDINTSIVPVDEAAGEYLLKIDPVSDAREIQVQVCAEAVIDGKTVEITSKVTTIEICQPEQPDDLKILEGIEKGVERVLNEHGIYTFHQLAYTEAWKINDWLTNSGFKYMDAKTWPQQARLKDIAKTSGKKEDQESFEAYLQWAKDGIEPDEHGLDEKDRRPAALEWHGNKVDTEKAYPKIDFSNRDAQK